MTETIAAETVLAGSDDPSSPFFVPVELREHYAVDEAAEQQALRATGTPTTLDDGVRAPLTGLYAGPLDMVRQQWADDVFARVAADPRLSRDYGPWIQDVAERDTPSARRRLVTGYLPESVTGPIPNDYTQADVFLWVHRWRLDRASAAAGRQRAAADEQRRWVASHTCVICSEQHDGVQGRDVHGVSVQSCRPCSILLAAAVVQQVATQRVGDRTRGELVRDYLAVQADRAVGPAGELAAALAEAAR